MKVLQELYITEPVLLIPDSAWIQYKELKVAASRREGVEYRQSDVIKN